MSTLDGFRGAATLETSDIPRLNNQLEAVREIMGDGVYRTLSELAKLVTTKINRNATEASVSARLRDLRKEKFGGYTVNRKSVGDGLSSYQVARTDGTPVITTPARPITYGQPGATNAAANSEAANTPVAGSRSAMAYANTLK